MILSKDKLISTIGQSILDTKTIEELEKLQISLETKPFCGIDICYDLEHLVFYIFNKTQQDAVLSHINSLPGNVHPHIFTTLDFISSLSQKEKTLFGEEDMGFITILSSSPENQEYTYRYRTKSITNSVISDLPKTGSNNLVDLKDILLDAESDNVAADYYKTIVNYTKLFPNYQPIWIDRLNSVSILLAKKMDERKELQADFEWKGALLKGKPSTELRESLKKDNIHFFETQRDLMDQLKDITLHSTN